MFQMCGFDGRLAQFVHPQGDLRDSGTIEQDADVVMFIYREEYYLERGAVADRARIGSVAGKARCTLPSSATGRLD